MRAWAQEIILALDVETTGTNVDEDRVVEVAVAEVGLTGRVTRPWCAIVDPGIEIPDEAAEVHGITTDRARAEGHDPAAAIAVVADRIFEHGWRRPIVMFNARFDWPILLAEAERYGIEFPGFAPILDPYLLDRLCDRFRPGRRQLLLVADHYDVELDAEEAHGALPDAIAAGRVTRRILERYPAIAEHTLGDVFVRQVRGHEADRDRFEDYMRCHRDPTFESSPGWPIPSRKARTRR